MSEVLVIIDRIGGYGGKKINAYFVTGWNTKKDKWGENSKAGDYGINIFTSKLNTFAVSSPELIEQALEILKVNLKVAIMDNSFKEGRVYMERNRLLALLDVKGDSIIKISPIRVDELPMKTPENLYEEVTEVDYFYQVRGENG